MSAEDYGELYFLLDRAGAIIAFQEKEQSWAGALAFSSELLAQDFIAASRLAVHEIATLDSGDREGVAGLVRALKKRPVRYLLLDLDYRIGGCQQIDFEGDGLGRASVRTFASHADHG